MLQYYGVLQYTLKPSHSQYTNCIAIQFLQPSQLAIHLILQYNTPHIAIQYLVNLHSQSHYVTIQYNLAIQFSAFLTLSCNTISSISIQFFFFFQHNLGSSPSSLHQFFFFFVFFFFFSFLATGKLQKKYIPIFFFIFHNTQINF